MAFITPSDWSLGVEGTLAVRILPPPSATRSVKVPPTSTPRRGSFTRSSLLFPGQKCVPGEGRYQGEGAGAEHEDAVVVPLDGRPNKTGYDPLADRSRHPMFSPPILSVSSKVRFPPSRRDYSGPTYTALRPSNVPLRARMRAAETYRCAGLSRPSRRMFRPCAGRGSVVGGGWTGVLRR